MYKFFLLFMVISASFVKADPVPLNVVTTIPPLEAIVKAVGGNHVSVISLVKGGGSPHFVQLKPSFIKELQGADLILSVSQDLEPFLHKSMTNLRIKKRWVQVSKIPSLKLLPFRHNCGCCGGHGHHHKHEHKHKHNHKHHKDPHLWLSPINGIALVDWVVARLSLMLPDVKEDFVANGKTLKAEIHKIDKENKALLKDIQKVPYVIVHDGFQYWQKHYGLNQTGIILTPGESQGRPRSLDNLMKKMKQAKTKCVLKEIQLPTPLAQKVARETGAKVYAVDPLSAGSYPELLKTLGQSFSECLRKGKEYRDDLKAGEEK